jgi:hypothetical protein
MTTLQDFINTLLDSRGVGIFRLADLIREPERTPAACRNRAPPSFQRLCRRATAKTVAPMAALGVVVVEAGFDPYTANHSWQYETPSASMLSPRFGK